MLTSCNLQAITVEAICQSADVHISVDSLSVSVIKPQQEMEHAMDSLDPLFRAQKKKKKNSLNGIRSDRKSAHTRADASCQTGHGAITLLSR